MDCDMLMRADIAELWALRDESASVMCVKHDYQPKVETKFLGQVQTKYEKKNWSSVMLFNNAKCRALTPDFVNTATGSDCISSNGWRTTGRSASCRRPGTGSSTNTTTIRGQERPLHGRGPYFDEYRNDDYADEWFAMRDRVLHVTQRAPKD